jgi:hypothetical protein
MANIFTYPLSKWSEANHSDHANMIDELEQGGILFFPELPFQQDCLEASLITERWLKPGSKNISYNPNTDSLKGCQPINEASLDKLHRMMSAYAQQAYQLIKTLCPHYGAHLLQGKTSFRPASVKERKTSYRKNDRLLHVDAFPANPLQGQRILRLFTNINPQGLARVWKVGETFSTIMPQFIGNLSKPLPGSHLVMNWLGLTKSKRSAYDHYMLKLHNAMKKSADYQQHCQQQIFSFPAGSTWAVFTDQVAHAALSGQHLLEQTFYLPINALKNPQHSPLAQLERRLEHAMV